MLVDACLVINDVERVAIKLRVGNEEEVFVLLAQRKSNQYLSTSSSKSNTTSNSRFSLLNLI